MQKHSPTKIKTIKSEPSQLSQNKYDQHEDRFERLCASLALCSCPECRQIKKKLKPKIGIFPASFIISGKFGANCDRN